MLIETVNLSAPPTNPLSPASNPAGGQVLYEPKGAGKNKENPTDSARTVELVMDLQKQLKMLHNVDLHFSVHEASGRVMVTVIDDETGKVLREIPNSEMLDLATKLEETIGLIFDTKA